MAGNSPRRSATQTPKGVQRLLRATFWDTDGVRDDLRDYVIKRLEDDANGVLIVDETGFLKKGGKSCGVAQLVARTARSRRSGAHAYWLAYGPAETTIEALVRVCDTRWQIEDCFAQAKGEVGMDHYEVRTWTAWHRFITLCLAAHALLVVLRAQARADAGSSDKRGMPRPSWSR